MVGTVSALVLGPVSSSLRADPEYPSPNFSGIDKWYTLLKYEYDSPRPWLMLTVKLKKDIGQYDSFSAHFLDEDGVEVEYIHVQPALGEFGHAGDVIHTKIGNPAERDMAKVKTIVFRREINYPLNSVPIRRRSIGSRRLVAQIIKTDYTLSNEKHK